jgi:hypothetical protein
MTDLSCQLRTRTQFHTLVRTREMMCFVTNVDLMHLIFDCLQGPFFYVLKSTPPPSYFDATGQYENRLKKIFFHFTPDSLRRLKADASINTSGDISETCVSTNDALCALLFASITRARHLDSDQVINCSYALDIRDRLDPSLPEGYFGNAIFAATIACTVGWWRFSSLAKLFLPYCFTCR